MNRRRVLLRYPRRPLGVVNVDLLTKALETTTVVASSASQIVDSRQTRKAKKRKKAAEEEAAAPVVATPPPRRPWLLPLGAAVVLAGAILVSSPRRSDAP